MPQIGLKSSCCQSKVNYLASEDDLETCSSPTNLSTIVNRSSSQGACPAGGPAADGYEPKKMDSMESVSMHRMSFSKGELAQDSIGGTATRGCDPLDELAGFFSLMSRRDAAIEGGESVSSGDVIEVHAGAQVGDEDGSGVRIEPLKLYKTVHGFGDRPPINRDAAPEATTGTGGTDGTFSHTAPNSVFFIPQLLTTEECLTLIRHSDSAHEDLAESDGARPQCGPFRYMAHLWPSPLAELVADVVANRLLPNLHTPGHEVKPIVRCISRHEAGYSGAPPHTDPGAFTVVVVLDDLSDASKQPFVGGGTEFWSEEVCDAEMLSQQPDSNKLPLPTLRVAPVRRGGAIIFGEGIVHAAGQVTEGVRHVLVLVFARQKSASQKRRP